MGSSFPSFQLVVKNKSKKWINCLGGEDIQAVPRKIIRTMKDKSSIEVKHVEETLRRFQYCHLKKSPRKKIPIKKNACKSSNGGWGVEIAYSLCNMALKSVQCWSLSHCDWMTNRPVICSGMGSLYISFIIRKWGDFSNLQSHCFY